MAAVVNNQQKSVGVILVIKDDDAKVHFNLLFQYKENIYLELRDAVESKKMLDKKESRIDIRHDDDPCDKDSCGKQHQWLKDKLEKFHYVSSKRIKSLDADEYQED